MGRSAVGGQGPVVGGVESWRLVRAAIGESWIVVHAAGVSSVTIHASTPERHDLVAGDEAGEGPHPEIGPEWGPHPPQPASCGRCREAVRNEPAHMTQRPDIPSVGGLPTQNLRGQPSSSVVIPACCGFCPGTTRAENRTFTGISRAVVAFVGRVRTRRSRGPRRTSSPEGLQQWRENASTVDLKASAVDLGLASTVDLCRGSTAPVRRHYLLRISGPSQSPTGSDLPA
jgi:hypothetical protein